MALQSHHKIEFFWHYSCLVVTATISTTIDVTTTIISSTQQVVQKQCRFPLPTIYVIHNKPNYLSLRYTVCMWLVATVYQIQSWVDLQHQWHSDAGVCDYSIWIQYCKVVTMFEAKFCHCISISLADILDSRVNWYYYIWGRVWGRLNSWLSSGYLVTQ